MTLPAVMRKARRDDIPAILALLADDDLGKLRDADVSASHAEAFAAIESDTNQILMVAEVGGVVVGCLQLTFIPGLSRGGMWRGQVEAVRVARSLRGQGLGASMMEWVIDTCRARGCGLVQLTSDKQRADAHRFYERLGFVASHEGLKLALS